MAPYSLLQVRVEKSIVDGLPEIDQDDIVYLLIYSAMDQAFSDKMKSLLVEEKGRLEHELSQFAHRNTRATSTTYDTDFPNIGDKEDENASEVAQFSDNLSLEDELVKQLRDVESAMRQFEKGVYGICKYCKLPIDERRLIARPTSSSCIQCKKTLTQEM